jgi:hypothetical protein
VALDHVVKGLELAQLGEVAAEAEAHEKTSVLNLEKKKTVQIPNNMWNIVFLLKFGSLRLVNLCYTAHHSPHIVLVCEACVRKSTPQTLHKYSK